MKSLVEFIWTDKKDVLLALLCGTIGGLTAVALFAQSGLLISKAALLPPFYIILILTAFLKLFGVTKSISKYTERLITHRVTFRFISKIRMLFFNKLLPKAHLLNTYKSGDLLTRVTTNVETVQNFFLRVLYPPFVTGIVFFTTCLFMLFFSTWIALCLLLGIVLTSLIVPYILLRIPHKTATEDKKMMTIEGTEYFYGYRDLVLHNQLEAKKQTLLQWNKQFAKAKQKELDQEQSAFLGNQLVALFTTFLILFIGAYLTSTKQLDGVYLAMIVLVSLTVFESAIPLAMAPNYVRHTKKAMQELNEISPTIEKQNGILLRDNIHSIHFNHVSYVYPNIERPAIEDINLSVQSGQKIAIIGPSGSGKSTILQLLMNEFEPSNGEILFDMYPLSSFDTDSIYKQLSIMLQHNHFFSGTIETNLQLAKPEATREKMQLILNKACLFKKLEDVVYEKGENLSGGEKQRLAFARFLLKDSPLLVLDEPFTSLDIQTERKLFQTLLNESTNKILILVTHKLIELDKFDCIFVMQNGRLVEAGKHAELISQQGLYFAMYQKQFNNR
ncbi:thiol reductant ABC exporter subunit CydC [Solibacillus sp. FSL W7-1436]|uniref:thiol reductant ABC exporter subunit CydC n=1 Tax=unclassified Solibacillus TaxID=2637870 RepID=UPI0030F56CE4